MATAYVSTTGGAAYPGTVGSPTTLALALANAAAGDTVYLAPGNYLNSTSLTYGGASGTVSSQVNFIGDSTGTFTSSTAGPVRITPVANIATGTTNNVLTITNKDYINFSNIVFENASAKSTLMTISGCTYITFTKCVFIGSIGCNSNGPTKPLSHTWSKCVMVAGRPILDLNVGSHTSAYNNPFVIEDCLIFPLLTGGVIRCIELSTGHVNAGGGNIRNCTFFGGDYAVSWYGAYSTSNPLVVSNCLFLFFLTALASDTTANKVIGNYNRMTTASLNNVTINTNSTAGGLSGVDLFDSLLTGINNLQPFSSTLVSSNASFGTASGAPATDMYGVTWTGTSPDAGSGTYRVITSNPTNIGYSGGIERNASAITIAPASTSQSIELYLGATGLTFATSGLAAYYVRNQSAPVAITLVTQTPTGAWASGGFAEISSSLVPGVYRLDMPNAAFAAGASDVTVVVRGASGTNGAVLTVTLSSGGLTAAQTAAAVWGASPAGYSDATTFGGVVNETNQLTNTIDQEVGDVPGNVWDELRTNHVTVGTFGQYVNAELVTPVTSAALVRMGPFEVRADGLGASDPLDIQKGAQHGIDIQCVDNNGAGIDITSATVTAKVYNSGATLVDTYSCTATYAADGRATFTIDTTVTNTPGTYTATITRSTSANDTQIFGPLRIYVRDI
jgi:hypothetical protein